VWVSCFPCFLGLIVIDIKSTQISNSFYFLKDILNWTEARLEAR
jgi:hypothetical protein